MTLRERLEHIALAEADAGYREAFVRMCASDAVFFVNACVMTYDPRLNPPSARYLPFLLFPAQEEYIRELTAAIDGGYDLLTEKSRDMGATWCILAVLLHHWLFEEGFTALIGSRKEDEVDKKGSPKTLFWKLDFMNRELPAFLKPAGFKEAQPWRTYLKIENPVTHSTLEGESSNADFGRGGRFKCIFQDEFASWEWAAAAWTSCQESTLCRLPCSTPKGMNFFGRMANPKDAATGIQKARLHWTQDPRKNEAVTDPATGRTVYPWYEQQKKRYAHDPSMMAQELDINYNMSVKGQYYPQIEYAKVGRFPRRPGLPLFVGWDFGRTDATALLWAQWDPEQGRLQAIDYFEKSGQTIEFFVPFVTGVVPSGLPWGYTEAEMRVIDRHRGWVVDQHFGDPAGRQRTAGADLSVIEALARPAMGAPNGIHVYTNTKRVDHTTRRHFGQKLLMRLDIDEDRCGQFLDCMRNARFPEVAEGSNSTAENNKPVHDWTSHGRSAYEYLAVNMDSFLSAPVDDRGGADEWGEDDAPPETWNAPRGRAGY